MTVAMRKTMTRLLALWWIVLPVAVVAGVLVQLLRPSADLNLTQALADVAELTRGVERFKEAQGSIPTLEQGLGVLRDASGQPFERTRDPWGSPYLYAPGGADDYLIYSIGVDGRDDRGGGDDVTTRDKRYFCEDYGVGCFPTKRGVVSLGFFALAAVSLFVGFRRRIRDVECPELVVDGRGYVLAGRRIGTLEELSAELQRRRPKRMHVIPALDADYDHLDDVLRVVRRIGGIDLGFVGNAPDGAPTLSPETRE